MTQTFFRADVLCDPVSENREAGRARKGCCRSLLVADRLVSLSADMDEQQFTETTARLKKVNAVITSLDPAVRAAAFEILQPYVEASPSRSKQKEQQDDDSGDDNAPEELEAFFDTRRSDKESENPQVVVAWWYSRYGRAPISYDDMRRIADEGDADIPDRLDAVALYKRDKKPMYRSAGTGRLKLTSSGETYIKTKYSVTKGRKSPPAANDE